MNPIELGKAIAEDGVAVITAVMLILVVGLVWYLIRRQAKREDKHDEEQREERLFNRNIISGELRKNVELNVKGIALQEEMIKDFKDHNGHSDEFSKKMVETLDLICKKIDRRRENKRVKVDRRI